MNTLKASDGYIWAHEGGCTGFRKLRPHVSEAQLERDEQAINEGIEAHKVLEDRVNGKQVPDDEYGIHADELLERWQPHRFTGVYSETEIPFFDSKLVIDLYGWNPKTGVLSIVEYKYGRSLVEVHDNPQLKLNATWLIDYLKLPVVTVEFVVFQPRGHHIDGVYRTCEWMYYKEYEDFRELVFEKQHENPMCRTGAHCLKCDAKFKCKAHTEAIMRCVDFVDDPEPLDREPRALGEELKLLQYVKKQVEKRISGLETEVEHLTRTGKITGWILKRKVGSMKWLYDAEKLISLFGVDLSKPVDTITPKQAIDRKILTKDVVEGITHRPDGGEKLVLDDSHRRLK